MENTMLSKAMKIILAPRKLVRKPLLLEYLTRHYQLEIMMLLVRLFYNNHGNSHPTNRRIPRAALENRPNNRHRCRDLVAGRGGAVSFGFCRTPRNGRVDFADTRSTDVS